MAERSNAAVLKTVSPQGLGGSNPSLSARIFSFSLLLSRCPGPYWLVPLWLSVPIVAVLWLSSWISGLDLATGNRTETYLIWALTAVASVSLLLALARRA